MPVTYTVHDSCFGIIELSNPPYNELEKPVFTDHATLREFLHHDNLKAVIVKGAKRHFCGGAHKESLFYQAASPDFRNDLTQGRQLLDIIEKAPVPVIAAIRGSCLGAGLEIALACHIRFATERAILGFPESELGFFPGFGGIGRVSEILPRSTQLELILEGTMITGMEAQQKGLVDYCTTAKNMEQDVFTYARNLVHNRSGEQIRAILSCIHAARHEMKEQALTQEVHLFCRLAKAVARNKDFGDG